MFYRRKNTNKNKNKDLKKKEESQKSINRRINDNKSSLKSAVTEYVSHNYAFSAIVKQSYFDFQVKGKKYSKFIFFFTFNVLFN